MSDNSVNNVRVNASTFNFNNEESMNAIRSSLDELIRKEGVYTVDDKGLIKVINPPVKRDNFFVSFYKSYIEGSADTRRAYRSQERLYDNIGKIAGNLSFQTALMKAVLSKASENGAQESKAVLSLMEEKLASYIQNNKGKIEGRQIGAVTDTTIGEKNASAIISKAVGKAKLSSNYDLGSVFCNGKSQNVFDFISQTADKSVMEKNPELFKDQKLDVNYLVQKLIAKCNTSPNDFKIFNLEKDAKNVKNLLTQASLGNLDKNDLKALGNNVSRILYTFKKNLADFARLSIEPKQSGVARAGKKPNEVANALVSILSDTCNSVKYNRKSSHVMRNTFDEDNLLNMIDKMADNPASSKSVQSKSDDKITNVLLKNYGNTLKNSSVTAAYIKENGFTEEDLNSFIKSPAGKSNPIKMLADPLPDNAMVLSNFVEDIGRRIESCQNIGMDKDKFIRLLAAQSLIMTKDEGINNLIKANLNTLIAGFDSALEKINRPRDPNIDKEYQTSIKQKLTDCRELFNTIKNILREQGTTLAAKSARPEVKESNDQVTMLDAALQAQQTKARFERLAKIINISVPDESDFIKLDSESKKEAKQSEISPETREKFEKLSKIINVSVPQNAVADTLDMSAKIYKLFDNFIAVQQISNPTPYTKEIIEKCANAVNTDNKDFAKRFICEIAKARIGTEGLGTFESDVKKFLDNAVNAVNKQPELLKLVDSRDNKDFFNQNFAKNYFINDKDGIVNSFNLNAISSEDKRDNNQRLTAIANYHNNFIVDLKRDTLSKIGITDLTNIPINDRTETAQNELNKIVPEDFRPFVTHLLQQGGVISILPNLYMSPDRTVQFKSEDMFELKKKSEIQLDNKLLQEQGFNVSNNGHATISRENSEEGSKLVIDVYNTLGLVSNAKPETGIYRYQAQKPIFIKNTHYRITIDMGKNGENIDEKTKIPTGITASFVEESYDKPDEMYKNRLIS